MAGAVFPRIQRVLDLQEIQNISWNLAEVGLFTNNFTPNKYSVVGDFIEPTYPSYFRSSFIGQGSQLGFNDDAYFVFLPAFFQALGSFPGVTIYGLFIVNISNGLLLLSCRFDEPINYISDAQVMNPFGRIGFGDAGYIQSHV